MVLSVFVLQNAGTYVDAVVLLSHAEGGVNVQPELALTSHPDLSAFKVQKIVPSSVKLLQYNDFYESVVKPVKEAEAQPPDANFSLQVLF